MEVGKRYKGYGILNEYGDYTFTPCEVMDERQERMRIVESSGGTTLYESKNYFKISVRISKKDTQTDFMALVHSLCTEIMRAVYNLRKYIK